MPTQKTVTEQRDAGATSHSGTAEPNYGTVPVTPAGAFLALPPGVRARIVVLFCALAVIKIALLLSLGKHLNEIHWRVGASRATWCHPLVAFYLFVGLGVLSLARLARHSRSVGVKAVRAANGIVLGLGLLFIFLTFHTGEKNYLYPIMTGILKWTSLGPYLSLDLFFRPRSEE